ncbi:MAG TPA: NAD(P)/FAD-dependent oxidoreductase [Cytophagaceae bacterium]|jgi:monoamine oxidase|nr:NAD(P)/FAD-dependent oxidoreductase [Cytophagaceae bacterium]
MQDPHVIIIGAGAAGLMAARTLAKAGLKVSILEGRDRIGGRICTLEESIFSFPAEAGAEFIHGDLPVTMKLLKEAGITYFSTEGKMWNARNGILSQGQNFVEGWPLVKEKMKELSIDLSIEDFLGKYFSGDQYIPLRKSLTGFVEGYDAADPKRASTFALREEWLSENDAKQYKIEGGYQNLINYLAKECIDAGVKIHLNAFVKEIAWEQNQVGAKTQDAIFNGLKLLLTVPLGVLQAGTISFLPDLPQKMEAANKVGFGSVIKILLGFKNKFWEDVRDKDGNNLKHLGFLFSGELVPTWWTQYPNDTAMLTGWFAGPKAKRFKTYSDGKLLDEALNSLTGIFNIKAETLRGQLNSHRIINWSADPFSLGAYGYATVETPEARKILAGPVANTLYFGGEALYAGAEMGTVEAALANGEQVGNEILKNFQ